MTLRVDLLAVVGDDEMEDLIDQAHGVDLTGFDGLLRIIEQVAVVVHLLRQAAGGVEIGQDDVAVEGVNGLIELVAVAGLAGDVKFHGYCPGVMG